MMHVGWSLVKENIFQTIYIYVGSDLYKQLNGTARFDGELLLISCSLSICRLNY